MSSPREQDVSKDRISRGVQASPDREGPVTGQPCANEQGGVLLVANPHECNVAASEVFMVRDG
jgi:hypothetical protein